MKISNKKKNERKARGLKPVCPNCKKRGLHFAPACMGEPGFFTCFKSNNNG